MPQSSDTTAYERTLLATEYFLRKVGVDGWADWLRQDIAEWQTNRDVSHHLRAYGGMGSLNDLIICQVNQHSVTAEQEPWVNSLFLWLKALLFYLSHQPLSVPTIDGLRNDVGKYAPSLVAFVGGEYAPRSMRGFVEKPMKICGMRCLACGHAEVTRGDIDYAIADQLLPELVFSGCIHNTLRETIDLILALDLPGLAEQREQVGSAARANGVEVSQRDETMRPCPKCGAEDTAQNRWLYTTDDPPKFEPSSDNLPLHETHSAAWKRRRQYFILLLVIGAIIVAVAWVALHGYR